MTAYNPSEIEPKWRSAWEHSKVFNSTLDVKKPKLRSKVTFFKTDITKEIELKKVITFLKKKKIKIDVLINGAAKDHIPNKNNKKKEKLDLENFSEKIWAEDLNVGLTGSLLTTKIFGSYMASKKSGVILNISSDLGIIAPNQSIYKKKGIDEKAQFVKPITYSVVKHGIIGLTKQLAFELGPYGINVNAICPSQTLTDMLLSSMDSKQREDLAESIPLRRIADIKDQVGPIMFLCSDASSYITGAVIDVNGGQI